MGYFAIFCRITLAAGFIPSGIVKVTGERFTDLHNFQPLGQYLEALFHTGPVASTIRPSTIAEPFYGYDPETGSEADFMDESGIAIMAVDNLPCELPKDASEGFGEMFLKHVIPAFFNDDKDGILGRARMTKEGKLTPLYSYLQDYVESGEL